VLFGPTSSGLAPGEPLACVAVIGVKGGRRSSRSDAQPLDAVAGAHIIGDRVERLV
jgi:hypothetical protein